jgi:FtsZ-interacting cell division protein ZipA
LHVLSDELFLRNYLAGGKGTPKQREAREEHTGENRAARKRPQQRTAGTTSKEFTTENSKKHSQQENSKGTTSKKTPTTENSRNNKQGIHNKRNKEQRERSDRAPPSGFFNCLRRSRVD